MLGATGQSKKLLCAVSIRVFSIGLVLRARGEVVGVRPPFCKNDDLHSPEEKKSNRTVWIPGWFIPDRICKAK